MASVTIMGGGICGMLTALLLGEDGHDVVVLERDPQPPPVDADEAWGNWQRRGVRQFHMGHWFHAGFKRVLDRELPMVIDALDDAGALRLNVLDTIPAEHLGEPRDDDNTRYAVITGRRPVIEGAIARVAAAHARVDVRRGVAVTGVITESAQIPHVVGVKTESGDEIHADILIDASGRNSPMPRFLANAGYKGPDEELEDSGFIYYGRMFRSSDGSIPVSLGGLLQNYDSISILTLPADAGTWFVAIIASGADAAMRACRQSEVFTRVISSYPLAAHWLEGEPMSDVEAMGKIEDRIRRYVVDGKPVVTGFAAVADAWACTNPSLGRGSTIGLYHAVALRDQLREDPTADPGAWAVEWAQRTARDVEPWYIDGLRPDRLRLAEIEAQIAGVEFTPDDPLHEIQRRLSASAMKHPNSLRILLDSGLMIRMWNDVLDDEDLIASLPEAPPDEPSLGPDRAALLELLTE